MLGFILYLHYFKSIGYFIFSMIVLFIAIYQWTSDICKETVFFQTNITSLNFSTGFLFFLASEISLFASFTWSLIYNSYSPTTSVGLV